jgi:hypothetical protein
MFLLQTIGLFCFPHWPVHSTGVRLLITDRSLLKELTSSCLDSKDTLERMKQDRGLSVRTICLQSNLGLFKGRTFQLQAAE